MINFFFLNKVNICNISRQSMRFKIKLLRSTHASGSSQEMNEAPKFTNEVEIIVSLG